MNFAYVRFIDDDHRCVVSTKDIKKFKLPVNYNKKYKVKFEEEYYHAQILCIGDDKTELLSSLKSKRISSLPLRMLQSDDQDSEYDSGPVDVSSQPHQSKMKKNTNPAEKENFNEILKALVVNNHDTNNNDSQDVMSLKKEISDLKEKILLLECTNAELRETNFSLQHRILDDWQVMSQQIKEILDQKVSASLEEVNKTAKDSVKELPPVGARTDTMVHCGRDVWIPKQIFDSLLARCKSDSVFIRDLAECIFGHKCLAESSVTGKSCNKTGTPARPALDGTKLMALQDTLRYKLMQQGITDEELIRKKCSTVKSILSQKIIDIKRGPRQTKNEKKQKVFDLEAAVETHQPIDEDENYDDDY